MAQNETEKKVLEQAKADFAKAVERFKESAYQDAEDLFGKLVDTYKDTEDYIIIEIKMKAGVYQKICHAQITESSRKVVTVSEHFQEGIFQLNSGNIDQALELLSPLDGNDEIDQAYLHYLLSLVYLRKRDIHACLNFLSKAIDKDSRYKIIAHNEPDYDPLFENESFLKMIELENSI